MGQKWRLTRSVREQKKEKSPAACRIMITIVAKIKLISGPAHRRRNSLSSPPAKGTSTTHKTTTCRNSYPGTGYWGTR
eukprot:864401-Rhodomonas_salina.5